MSLYVVMFLPLTKISGYGGVFDTFNTSTTLIIQMSYKCGK